MKTFRNLSLILVLLTGLFITSCKKENTGPDPAFDALSSYLQENSMDLPDMLSDWIIPASSLVDNTDSYSIFDLRLPADYELGCVPGAVNVSLGTLLEEAANATKPIIVVCYTGQTAGHAVIALRLSGYSDAKVLMFGMSGWHSDFDSWTANVGDGAVGHANWTTDATATLEMFDYPAISTDLEDGAAILEERVQELLANGFQGIASADVLEAPASYFINNYWAQTDVDHYGHIAGAYRVNPMSLANGDFENMDPEQTIVTYCWTGQTSSMITAYLNVLGYTAKSLKFGTNSMIYSQLESHKWSASADYDYEIPQ